jgi:hypothetical protein
LNDAVSIHLIFIHIHLNCSSTATPMTPPTPLSHPSKELSSMRHFGNQSFQTHSCLPTFYPLSYLPTYLHRPPSFYSREGSIGA